MIGQLLYNTASILANGMTIVYWQPYNARQHADLKENWCDWLLHPHSFMLRLNRAGVQGSAVQVLKQAWQLPTLEEAMILDIPERQVALIREVLIGNKAGKWMFARTVFPRVTLTGPEQPLARLKSRALGTVLFKNKKTIRGDFEICQITPASDWHRYISHRTFLGNEAIWGRRSEFFIKNKSLLLTEIFLPDMKKIIEGAS